MGQQPLMVGRNAYLIATLATQHSWVLFIVDEYRFQMPKLSSMCLLISSLFFPISIDRKERKDARKCFVIELPHESLFRWRVFLLASLKRREKSGRYYQVTIY